MDSADVRLAAHKASPAAAGEVPRSGGGGAAQRRRGRLGRHKNLSRIDILIITQFLNTLRLNGRSVSGASRTLYSLAPLRFA